DEAGRHHNPATAQTDVEMINADKLPGTAGQSLAPVSGTWRQLFNGQSMDSWTKMNAGNWIVENGLLKYTGGGNGWLRSNDEYKDYALIIEWRYTQPGNNDSGIFLRAGMGGNPWPDSPQLN